MSLRRFYRRHRILVTAVIIAVVALILVGRIPLMPNADTMFTPISGVSSFIASPAAGAALMFRQRSRKAMRWYGLAMFLGATAPMLIGYFHNMLPDGIALPSSLNDFTATLSSFAPTLLFIGGSCLGIWLARKI